MQRFAILDDENEFLLKIKNIFNKYHNIQLDLYLDPFDLIEAIDRYDVIFIDYEMPVMNAFDFFEKTKNNHYLKIVITNYDQMIFDSLSELLYDGADEMYVRDYLRFQLECQSLDEVIHKLEGLGLSLKTNED